MTTRGEKLLQQVPELPEADRTAIAARLIERLDSEADEGVEAAWADEIRRRIAAIDSGQERILDWDDVEARLFRLASEPPSR